MAMDPELLPALVNYYQQAQYTKEVGHSLDLKRLQRNLQKLQKDLTASQQESLEAAATADDLRTRLAQAQATSDVRQREIESLRSRHQTTDKADKTIAETLKVQADSFKREIGELRDDLKLRTEELEELRQDAMDRDRDLKAARDTTRTRDKEIKDVRDQVRARESEMRKANHLIEKLQTNIQGLEADLAESRDALDAAREALAEAEDRNDSLQAQKQIVPTVAARAASPIKSSKPKVPAQRPREPTPPMQDVHEDEDSDVPAPTPLAKSKSVKRQSTPDATDYSNPPSMPSKQVKGITKSSMKAQGTKAQATKKPVKRVSASAEGDKENHGVNSKAFKKAKAAQTFNASPPASSPAAPTPKRNPKPKKKPDFSMTPGVDKTNGKISLSSIPLSPPTPAAKALSRKADTMELLKDDNAKPKKKRKLLGGVKSLMDDTPKKVTTKAAKVNFGKELSPLKRPSSGLRLE